MGGNRMMPWEYDRLDDWTILNVYLAPRDKDTGELRLLRDRLGITKSDLAELERYGKRRPTIKELDIPREAWLMGATGTFVRMWWELWRSDLPGRGKTSEQTMELFKAKLRQCPPRMGFDQTQDAVVQTVETIEPPAIQPQAPRVSGAMAILTVD
jgi:hypothetical protein